MKSMGNEKYINVVPHKERFLAKSPENLVWYSAAIAQKIFRQTKLIPNAPVKTKI